MKSVWRSILVRCYRPVSIPIVAVIKYSISVKKNDVPAEP